MFSYQVNVSFCPSSVVFFSLNLSSNLINISMEREYSDEKVIISRKRLEELEQESNTLKLQLEEERKKFKESVTYCITSKVHNFMGLHVFDEMICCNSDVIKKLSDKIQQQEKAFEGLMKYSKALESFYKLPFYKRIFHKTLKLK